MREINLIDLLRAGAHFGHQTSRWNPKMRPFIFTQRNGVSIIDLEKTKVMLEQAAAFLQELGGRGGVVLYVATKRQAKPIAVRYAQEAGMPYVVDRWLGGTFTNFSTIHRLIDDFRRLKDERGSGGWDKYTKKEQIVRQREVERLEKLVGGIATLTKTPDAIIIVDVKQEKTAVREAQARHVPIVALVDTNVNPSGIDHPIPANDDATKSIDYLLGALTEAFTEGRQAFERSQADAAIAAAAAATSVPEAPVAQGQTV